MINVRVYLVCASVEYRELENVMLEMCDITVFREFMLLQNNIKNFSFGIFCTRVSCGFTEVPTYECVLTVPGNGCFTVTLSAVAWCWSGLAIPLGSVAASIWSVSGIGGGWG